MLRGKTTINEKLSEAEIASERMNYTLYVATTIFFPFACSTLFVVAVVSLFSCFARVSLQFFLLSCVPTKILRNRSQLQSKRATKEYNNCGLCLSCAVLSATKRLIAFAIC